MNNITALPLFRQPLAICPALDARLAGNAAADLPAAAQDALVASLANEIDCGLIICDSQWRVRYANPAARQELAQYSLLQLDAGRLGCVPASRVAGHSALRRALLKDRRQLLLLSDGGDRLMVSVVPLAMPGANGERLALVMLGRRGACSPLGLEMLGRAHGLTLSEQRVLAGLMGGLAPRSIAAVHGVALSTVRTQIAAIRAKLGAANVESLMLRVSELPPLAPALRGTDARRPGPAPGAAQARSELVA
jgi:DNA-binding CsgD family transcriptional regulator